MARVRRQWAAAAVAGGVGLLVLVVGWWLGVPEVASLLPGLETMKANTAVGIALLGLALAPWTSPRTAWVRPVAAAGALAIGAATVVQYATGADLGIDQLLATDPASSGSGPGRPGLTTALCFVLLGTALLVRPATDADARAAARATLAQVLASVTGLVALLAVMGYVFGAVAGPGGEAATEMALPTALLLLVATVGTVEASSATGALGTLRADNPAGRLLRVLLPATVVGLAAIGVVVALLREAGVVEQDDLLLALQATGGVGLVLVVTGLVVRRLDAATTALEVSRRELLELNAELEERIERRTAELREAAEELGTANEELVRFSHAVAHDLKGPIGILVGMVDLAGMALGDGAPDRARGLLDRARDQGLRLAEMTDGLLAYATVPSGEQAVPVPLDEVAAWVADLVAPQLAEVGGRLEVSEDLPVVRGREPGLRQVLLNLVSNAITYRSPDRPLEVRVGTVRVQDGVVQVAVVDNGRGVAVEDRERVFDVGVRVGDPVPGKGLGLGLAAVRRVVDRHGGRIWLEGAPDGPGTAVQLLLPAA